LSKVVFTILLPTFFRPVSLRTIDRPLTYKCLVQACLSFALLEIHFIAQSQPRDLFGYNISESHCFGGQGRKILADEDLNISIRPFRSSLWWAESVSDERI